MSKLRWDGLPHNRPINFSRWLVSPLSQVAALDSRKAKARRRQLRPHSDVISKPEAVRIGRAIRRLRTGMDLTQMDLAARLRWSPSAVGGAERGLGLTRRRVRRVAAVLNVRLEALTSAPSTSATPQKRVGQNVDGPRRSQTRRTLRMGVRAQARPGRHGMDPKSASTTKSTDRIAANQDAGATGTTAPQGTNYRHAPKPRTTPQSLIPAASKRGKPQA